MGDMKTDTYFARKLDLESKFYGGSLCLITRNQTQCSRLQLLDLASVLTN